MKKIILLLWILNVSLLTCVAQEYVPGELIVKFKASNKVTVTQKEKRCVSGVSHVDKVFDAIGVKEQNKLFSEQTANKIARKIKAFNGAEIDVPDMNQTYQLCFDSTRCSVPDAVEQLQALDEVEYAEPNYIVTAFDDEETVPDFNDPMFPEQTYLNEVNIPWLLQQPTINISAPIAIMDTGVEPHQDLCLDVMSCYDFIYSEEPIQAIELLEKGKNMDRNGHGTHCAGIAAAYGYNGLGIVGANPGTRIRSYAVLQANGQGDVASIIEALNYYCWTPKVISMSFGMYASSTALKEALINASQHAILVAAAGNDKMPIKFAPCFPAAYPFVVGVMAPDTGISNYDDDPIHSSYSEGYNYEVSAPGKNIISTYPGDTYRKLTGTSMACPMVAGIISRLLQTKEYSNYYQLIADLIHTSGTYIDAKAAYLVEDSTRVPDIAITDVSFSDANTGDANNLFAAGETIEIFPQITNYWGNGSNITISASLQENEDPDIVEFLNNDVELGSVLSDYASATPPNGIQMKINSSCADKRIISLRLRVHCDGISEYVVCDTILTVNNAVEIGGIHNENFTLHPGIKYMVSKDLYVSEGVTLTVEPGTAITLGQKVNFVNNGHLDWHGTAENPIIVNREKENEDEYDWNAQYFQTGNDTISYTRFSDWERVRSYYSILGNFYKCQFSNINVVSYISSIDSYRLKFNGFFNCCNIVNNMGNALSCNGFMDFKGTYKSTNIAGNKFEAESETTLHIKNIIYTKGAMSCEHNHNDDGTSILDYSGCNFTSNLLMDKVYDFRLLSHTANEMSLLTKAPCYYGSAKDAIVKEYILDADNYYMDISYSDAALDISNKLNQPSSEAPGIVWKVVVNGYDAQDEYDMLPPLGLGRHKFEVYFNRPMNKEAVPVLTMGVRTPFTQTVIDEDGSWNEDGTIYTAYLTLEQRSNIDGINRIRVSGAEDLEHFTCATEYHRFNVNVQVANSLATTLQATAGPNKVTLHWNTVDAPDLMGYNIYWVNPEVSSEVTKLNDYVIDGSINDYVVTDLTPGVTYTFYVKEIRTGLVEYDMSNSTTAVPYSLMLGDANDSRNVDVADVIAEVAYITEQNPYNFSFESADVNTDNKINVLDVVGTLNIILGDAPSLMEYNGSDACCQIEDDVLYLTTDRAVAGIQLTTADDVAPMECMNGFSKVSHQSVDGNLFLAYSMEGDALAPGRYALMKLNGAKVKSIILSDAAGRSIPVVWDDDSTDINAVTVTPSSNIYDLTGRRVQKPQKGINIINSKKYVQQ